MPTDQLTVRSITGSQTTAGAAEETVAISLDGSAPAASVAVAAGTTLLISDWVCTATNAASWRLQQANDGVTWFDTFLLRQPTDGTVGVSEFGTGIKIVGGPTVAIRVRTTTPGGATAVTTSLRAYSEAAV